jgi:mono/diheme cytochrome c family protein
LLFGGNLKGYTAFFFIYTLFDCTSQRVFNAHCDQCHPGGEAGLGPALNNKPLPPFLMKIQVRRGLGAMPGFSEKLISDRELDNLIAYTKALRHHR